MLGQLKKTRDQEEKALSELDETLRQLETTLGEQKKTR
jgi:hypothetical protein